MMITNRTNLQLENQYESSRKRINYIDVAKGMLILIVIFNHIPNLATAVGISNDTINHVYFIRSFFTSFFMPAFFVIAGYCSNYMKSFRDFFISNAKSLLFPAVTLLVIRVIIREMFNGCFSPSEWLNGISLKTFLFDLGHWNWFLTALFSTKMLFYFILKYVRSDKVRLVVIILLHILGVFLYNYKLSGILFFNFYYYQHALMYLIYIEIGYVLSKKVFLKSGFWMNTVIYSLLMVTYIGLKRKSPFITSDPFLPVADIIPHFVMSVCGSLMVLHLSKIINKNRMLELFGRHSLVIYCLHFQFIFVFYDVFWEQLNGMGTRYTIVALFILYIFTAASCLYCSILLNQKYLKWIVGKF